MKNKTLTNIFWLSIFLLTAFIAYKVISFQNSLDKKVSNPVGSVGGENQRKDYH